jgi:hypothetical protein
MAGKSALVGACQSLPSKELDRPAQQANSRASRLETDLWGFHRVCDLVYVAYVRRASCRHYVRIKRASIREVRVVQTWKVGYAALRSAYTRTAGGCICLNSWDLSEDESSCCGHNWHRVRGERRASFLLFASSLSEVQRAEV